MQRQKYRLRHPLVTFLIFGFLMGSMLVVTGHTVPVYAASAAKCAILDQGQVACPGYLGSLPSGSCWYEDPGAKNAGTKPAWTQEDCNSATFQGAANPQVTPAEDPALTTCSGTNCDLIAKYINPLIATLSAAVGVVVTISIVYGGIQYASSGGDPQKSAAAKSRITNSIFVLVAFFLLFAFLSWLIPGGLLNT